MGDAARRYFCRHCVICMIYHIQGQAVLLTEPLEQGLGGTDGGIAGPVGTISGGSFGDSFSRFVGEKGGIKQYVTFSLRMQYICRPAPAGPDRMRPNSPLSLLARKRFSISVPSYSSRIASLCPSLLLRCCTSPPPGLTGFCGACRRRGSSPCMAKERAHTIRCGKKNEAGTVRQKYDTDR